MKQVSILQFEFLHRPDIRLPVAFLDWAILEMVEAGSRTQAQYYQASSCRHPRDAVGRNTKKQLSEQRIVSENRSESIPCIRKQHVNQGISLHTTTVWTASGLSQVCKSAMNRQSNSCMTKRNVTYRLLAPPRPPLEPPLEPPPPRKPPLPLPPPRPRPGASPKSLVLSLVFCLSRRLPPPP